MQDFISPQNVRIANEVLVWAEEYLTTIHPDVKRPTGNQVICPFAKSSLENNSFYLVFHPEVNGHSAEVIERTVLNYINPFKKIGPYDTKDKLKKCLLIIFPAIPEDETSVLDIVQANIKLSFVDTGLMVGQFHQNCDDRGVYNKYFRISKSPYPLIAIRHMAIHDIIFLGDNEDYFDSYNIRFGEKFNEPEKLEESSKPLLEYYLKAKKRFLK